VSRATIAIKICVILLIVLENISAMTEGEPTKKMTDTNKNRNVGSDKSKSKGRIQTLGRNVLNSDTAVPMLKYGAGNNFDLFKKRIAVKCMEKYCHLGRLIEDEAYYTPPPMDISLFDLSNDPHEVEKARLREAHKHRDKEIDNMRIDRVSIFAYLISKLSKESVDKLHGHKDWNKIELERDPLNLWKIIKECHQTLTTSKVASVIKKTAREEYASCKQGMYESIMEYKQRFDARLDAYKASRNAAPTPEDEGMDFLNGLDNSRYAEFKAEIINDIQKGTLTQPKDLNMIYIMASQRVVVRNTKDNTGGATFATIEEGTKRNGKSNQNTKGKKEATAAAKLAKRKCYNGGEPGHISKGCPHKEKEDKESADDPPMAGMTLAEGGCCVARTGQRKLHQWYEICLDNGSQVNIVDSRLLSNLRTEHRTYRSMNGVAETKRVGKLNGFFECQACKDCLANILSMAVVEDLYPICYLQGDSITVHMEDRDVTFVRGEKMYVADFTDWIVDDETCLQEMYQGLSLMTVSDRERMYTCKEVHKALEAGELLKSLG